MIKKYGVVGFFSLALSACLLFPTRVTANGSQGTTGKASFIPGSGQKLEILKPGTEEVLWPKISLRPREPTGDRVAMKHVYLLHAPSFAFGVVDIPSQDTEYPVLEGEFTTNRGELIYLPDFIQVVDLSGKLSTQWEVSVVQKAAFKSKASGHTLSGTRLRLYEQTLVNSQKEILGQEILGYQLGQLGFQEIPLATEAPIAVLATKQAGFSHNTYTSLVLKKDYRHGDYRSGLTEQPKHHQGARLSVPAQDHPRADEAYQGELIWTLSVTP